MAASDLISRRGILLAAVAGSGLLALDGCATRGTSGAHASRASHAAGVTSPRPDRAGAATPTPGSATPKAALPARIGDVLGGTITIAGSGLDGVQGLRFGGAVAVVREKSATSLTVTVPAAPDYQPGSVPVTLDTPGGSIRLGTYTYAAHSPVGRQMAYALRYWKNYNTARYGSLNSVGGDCANFVSQTLVARGWAMNDVWHDRDAGAQWTPVWGYVPAMDDYFLAHGDALGLERLDDTQRDRVTLGDIGIFDWEHDGDRDHVEVVDRITHDDGTIKIAFASHNLDYAYRDLDETITEEHPGATMHFWHAVHPESVGGFGA